MLGTTLVETWSIGLSKDGLRFLGDFPYSEGIWKQFHIHVVYGMVEI